MLRSPPGDLRLPAEDIQIAFQLPPRSRIGLFRLRHCTRADLSLGRWPATITCFFSYRTVHSVPSLALRRAGLPRWASQQKNDGHELPCGRPLPAHGTTLNYFASKQTTSYAAFVSRRGLTLSNLKWHQLSRPPVIAWVGTIRREQVDEGRKCALRSVMRGRAYYVVLDLSYYDFTGEGTTD